MLRSRRKWTSEVVIDRRERGHDGTAGPGTTLGTTVVCRASAEPLQSFLSSKVNLPSL